MNMFVQLFVLSFAFSSFRICRTLMGINST